MDASGRVPPSVRWLPLARAASVRCAPRLPVASSGALLYRFAGPGEAETWAVQFEPVDEVGRRLACSVRDVVVKRPSVAGSSFGLGRRVFCAVAGTSGAGCWLVEGPLDALALCRLDVLGLIALNGAAVFGVAGVPGGFAPRACWAEGPVVMAPDGDEAGLEATVRLGAALRDAGRANSVRRPPGGADWSDLARDAGNEREGIVEH